MAVMVKQQILLLRSQGWTVQQIASAVGMSRQTIHGWLLGRPVRQDRAVVLFLSMLVETDGGSTPSSTGLDEGKA